MALPTDYAERVYAGVLGKIIGVYLGRPFEGWSYDRIMSELGEIRCYVNDKLGRPLIVTDDDISGTFTFLRALPDYGNTPDLKAQQIGQTWLNYIIERRTILWWGGLGRSTEHTAYLRLKRGIPAPESGSIRTNGKTVAEQIGAQIFIDGWAMVAPGDPELAASLAGRAASVSHDGEAIYGAQVVAALESQAFVESDIHRLIDCAVSFIPMDSVIHRMIHDIREWHAREKDWRKTRQQIEATYGYDRYGGNCHIVPNHALIIHSLLHGEDDFQRSLMIVNTSGWDTDCNSGNVGCLLGIKNGLGAIDAGPDWRRPVADRLYLATADGGRAITDAVTETYHIVNAGRALAGEASVAPKDGARFHFELPGAVQGFQVETGGTASIANVEGHSARGRRSLAIHYQDVSADGTARVATPTFIPPDAIDMPGYGLLASPTLYPGQIVRARVSADVGNSRRVDCRLFVCTYGEGDELDLVEGPAATLRPGAEHELEWKLEDTSGAPIAQVGVWAGSEENANGTLYLDYLTWDGAPEVVLTRPEYRGTMWRRAWVDGVDQYEQGLRASFCLIQNEGTGLLATGAREWTDYRVSATVTAQMVKAGGICARVQGMCRYYALLLDCDGSARLVKALDGNTSLAEASFPWEFERSYELALEVRGNRIQGWIDGRQVVDVEDGDRPLTGGGVALLCEEGVLSTDAVRVQK